MTIKPLNVTRIIYTYIVYERGVQFIHVFILYGPISTCRLLVHRPYDNIIRRITIFITRSRSIEDFSISRAHNMYVIWVDNRHNTECSFLCTNACIITISIRVGFENVLIFAFFFFLTYMLSSAQSWMESGWNAKRRSSCTLLKKLASVYYNFHRNSREAHTPTGGIIDNKIYTRIHIFDIIIIILNIIVIMLYQVLDNDNLLSLVHHHLSQNNIIIYWFIRRHNTKLCGSTEQSINRRNWRTVLEIIVRDFFFNVTIMITSCQWTIDTTTSPFLSVIWSQAPTSVFILVWNHQLAIHKKM